MLELFGLFGRDLRMEMRVRSQRMMTRMVAALVWGIVAALLGTIGIVFLLNGAVIALLPEVGPALAYAIVGGAVLVCALVAGLVAARRPRPVAGPAFVPPPVVPPLAADPSAMRPGGGAGKTGLAMAGGALLAGLILGRRL